MSQPFSSSFVKKCYPSPVTFAFLRTVLSYTGNTNHEKMAVPIQSKVERQAMYILYMPRKLFVRQLVVGRITCEDYCYTTKSTTPMS